MDERLSDTAVFYNSSTPAPAAAPATTSRLVADLTGAKLAERPAAAPAASEAAPAEPERLATASLFYGDSADAGLSLAGVVPKLGEEALPAGFNVALDRLGADAVALVPPEERAQISRAFVEAGLGRTTADAVVAAAADAFKINGGAALSDQQVTERNQACRDELQRAWGNNYSAKMNAARAVFQKAAAAYPDLADVAVDLGLATDPKFIRMLEARSRRAGKGT